MALGTVSSPSRQYTGDTNTGEYSSAADTLNGATGGVLAYQFGASWILAAAPEDSRTTTVDVVGEIRSTTSGVPAAGIGVGILFTAESADENPSNFGEIDFAATDITAASEDTYMDILLRVAGAALTASYRFSSTGTARMGFTHAAATNRSHTIPDVANDTLALIAATQTLTNKTLTAPVLSGSATGTYTLAGTPTLGANLAASAGVDITGLDELELVSQGSDPTNSGRLRNNSNSLRFHDGTAARIIALTNTPTFLTNITAPLVIGGTAIGSTLSLRSTSGVGTTDAIIFQVGNDGATEAGRFTNAGYLALGTTVANSLLEMLINDAGNNSLTTLANLTHNTTGTPANGLGVAMQFAGETSTTVGKALGSLNMLWTDVTDATSSAAFTISLRDNNTNPAEKMRLTAVGNLKIVGTALRATTEGTNHLDIFDGTAPAGGLTTGISLYSTSGELRVMDSGGTATLLSPHGKDGYWIFESRSGKTGKMFRVQMERLMYELDEMLGGGFIQEIEEDNHA